MTSFRPYRGKISILPSTCLVPATVPPTLQIMWIIESKRKLKRHRERVWAKEKASVVENSHSSREAGETTKRSSATDS